MSIENPEPTDSVEVDEAESRKQKLREQLKKGQAKMAELRASGWTPTHRNPVEQSQANPGSLKAAIKAFCWTCVGQDADPGAKFRVRDCDVGPKCPLFLHRPWQKVKGGLKYNDDGELIHGNEQEEDTTED